MNFLEKMDEKNDKKFALWREKWDKIRIFMGYK